MLMSSESVKKGGNAHCLPLDRRLKIYRLNVKLLTQRNVNLPAVFSIPGDLAPSAQSMIFLANRNPYQHALQA